MKKSFADKFPEIAKQWHPTKNGDLKPSDVTVGSGKSVYWICPNNPEHVWPTRVNARAWKRMSILCRKEKAWL